MKTENKIILVPLTILVIGAWFSGYSAGWRSAEKEDLAFQELSSTVEELSEANVRALLEAGRAMTKLSELEVWVKSAAEVDLRKNRGSYLAAAAILEDSGLKWEVSGTGWSNGWDDQIYYLSATRDDTRYHFKYFYPETDVTEVSSANGKGPWLEDGRVERAVEKWIMGAYNK